MASYEEMIRQKMGLPIQNMSNQMGQQVDQAAQQKLQALQALSAQQAPPPQAPMPQPMAPQPPPEVQPNAASMNPADQQSRMRAMIQAPLTMDQVAAKLRAQADEDAVAEHHANSLADEDMSGYKDYHQAAAPSPKFQQLKQRLESKPQDIRAQLKGPQEVTPELEKQLGYGDDDEEEKKAHDVNNKSGRAEGSYSGS